MSFSVSYVGSPEAIKSKLNAHSLTLTGQSKMEFDAVLPSVCTIIDQNVSKPPIKLALEVIVNGHANFDPLMREKQSGSCSVTVRTAGVLAEEDAR